MIKSGSTLYLFRYSNNINAIVVFVIRILLFLEVCRCFLYLRFPYTSHTQTHIRTQRVSSSIDKLIGVVLDHI